MERVDGMKPNAIHVLLPRMGVCYIEMDLIESTWYICLVSRHAYLNAGRMRMFRRIIRYERRRNIHLLEPGILLKLIIKHEQKGIRVYSFWLWKKGIYLVIWSFYEDTQHNPHHDDVIKWKHFPRYWPFVREIHRSPVNFPHKGQWRGALMFSVICVW